MPKVISHHSPLHLRMVPMAFGNYTGWMSQSLVWGAYPGELVKD